jgi:hypothetical protein
VKFFLTFLSTTALCFGCSVVLRPADQLLKRMDHIFVGRVINEQIIPKSTTGYERRWWTLKVSESIKGNDLSIVRVYGSSNRSGLCGDKWDIFLGVGQEYLVLTNNASASVWLEKNESEKEYVFPRSTDIIMVGGIAIDPHESGSDPKGTLLNELKKSKDSHK